MLLRIGRRAALVIALAVGAVVTLTPANGAASDIANGFVRAVRHLAAPSRDGQAFTGTPAVGALFTASAVGSASTSARRAWSTARPATC